MINGILKVSHRNNACLDHTFLKITLHMKLKMQARTRHDASTSADKTVSCKHGGCPSGTGTHSLVVDYDPLAAFAS
jgi:hypothetical protein